MVSRNVTESTRISLAVPCFAEELFALTDRNREFLREWLPWLDETKTTEDSSNFHPEVEGIPSAEIWHRFDVVKHQVFNAVVPSQLHTFCKNTQ